MQRIIDPYGAQHHYSGVTFLSNMQQDGTGGKFELELLRRDVELFRSYRSPNNLCVWILRRHRGWARQ
jgi:hypothetical protein